MVADIEKRLEYIHSLQETVCMNYRKMTEEEVILEEKVCRCKVKMTQLIAQGSMINLGNHLVLKFMCLCAVLHVDAELVGLLYSTLEGSR